MSLTAIAFLLAFGGGLVAALVRNPCYGLYTYLGVFYLHPPDRWWGQDLPDLRWSLLAGAVTLLATLRLPARPDRPGWLQSGAAWILLVLTAWLWIQNLWALSPEDHLTLSVLYTKYIVLFYLMYTLLDTDDKVRNFLLVHVMGCLYLGWLVWQAPDGGRLEGVGGPGINEANALGMQLSTGAIAAAVLLLGRDTLPRLMALLGAALILNGISQTGSRGSFLGLLTGGLAMVYLGPGRQRRYWFLFGSIGLVGLLYLAPDTFWDRMRTITDPVKEDAEVDQSTATRLALIQVQWDVFLEYPAGTGHRGTAVLSSSRLGEEHLTRLDPEDIGSRSSHNTFMTALAEHGFPGAILYVLTLGWAWRNVQQFRRQYRDLAEPPTELGLYMTAAAGSLAAVLMAGMFTDYYKAEVLLWCLALIAVLREQLQSRYRSAASETTRSDGNLLLADLPSKG